MKKLILTVLFTAMALTTAHALSWSQMAAAENGLQQQYIGDKVIWVKK